MSTISRNLSGPLSDDLAAMIDGLVPHRPAQRRNAFAYQRGRDLTQADWELARAAPAGPGTNIAPISAIKARHHNAARLFAAGFTVPQISAQTGYSHGRLYALQADAAFAELVAHYKTREDERFDAVQQRLELLGLAAAEEILERLETAPEAVSTETLRSLVATMLDRAGHAPVQRQQSLVVKMSREELMELKGEIDGRSTATVAIRDRAALSPPADETAGAPASSEAATGSEGSGPSLREGAGPRTGELLPAGRSVRADGA